MNPKFASLFVHPRNHKPLAFYGNVEGGDGIPMHVLSPDQPWSKEIISEIEAFQREKWIEKRWGNGFLWALEEDEMYPVIDGIPIFAPEQTWPPLYVRQLREERWIKKNWESCKKPLIERSKLTKFAEIMAESEGLILDVASGSGGGFVPRILHLNPQATVLMDDLGLGVLQEWQRFLKNKDIPNVSFALFDATKMPLKSNSIDIVSDLGGFDNIRGSIEGIKEAYRVLKTSGTLFSYNSIWERDDYLKLPKEMREKPQWSNEPFFEGYLEVFTQVGFEVTSNTFVGEMELSPNEGDLPKEADKYGVTLHVKQYCTEVMK